MRLSINFHRMSARAALAILGLTFSLAAQAYGLRIANRTQFIAGGEVVYLMCKTDKFVVNPGQVWTTNGRGGCLIRAINGVFAPSPVTRPPPIVNYSSSGTAYEDFIIAPFQGQARIWSANELANHNRATAAAPAPAPTAPTGPTVTWVPVASGAIPPKAAFIGGRQRFGGRNDAQGNAVWNDLPVCRGEVNGAFAIGNATPWYGHATSWTWDSLRCVVNLGGQERELLTYDVLIVDPQVVIRSPNSVRWAAATNGALPPGAYNTAKSGEPMYGCRATTPETDGALRVGVMAANGCYVSYGGHYRHATNYDVLVVEGSASAQLARGVNEPRLAAMPDRPLRVARAGEDCSRPSGRCQARIDELRAMTTYKINSVLLTSASGNNTTRYKKSQGNVWEMRDEGNTYNGGKLVATRPYVEVERNDNHITLFSGPWDFGGANGKVGEQTIIFAVNNGMVNVGAATQQVTEGTSTAAGRPTYSPSYGWRVTGGSQNIDRAMMADPETAKSITFKPINAGQSSTFWKGGSQPQVMLKDKDGNFGNYRVASAADGWLELYTVVAPQGASNKWQVHFLAVDFMRNRVWESLGITDRQPPAQDVASLRNLAKSAGPTNAWAEAYELTNASVFSGSDNGTALGRIGDKQVAWTLREDAAGVVRWEELVSGNPAAARGVADGAPVGRLVTQGTHNERSISFSGSEFGSPLTLDWVSGTVSAGGRRVGDFLTGSAEYLGQRKKLPAPTPPGISPGFQFVNKTDWPVMVKIKQVGCLYHGVCLDDAGRDCLGRHGRYGKRRGGAGRIGGSHRRRGGYGC